MLTSACARLMAVSTSPRACPSGFPICVLTDRAIASLFLENSAIHLTQRRAQRHSESQRKSERVEFEWPLSTHCHSSLCTVFATDLLMSCTRCCSVVVLHPA